MTDGLIDRILDEKNLRKPRPEDLESTVRMFCNDYPKALSDYAAGNERAAGRIIGATYSVWPGADNGDIVSCLQKIAGEINV